MRIAPAAVMIVAMVGGTATLASAKPKASKQAALELNSTSWEFAGEDGVLMHESIGPDGVYVIHAGGKHVDHGKAVVNGGKACFTSAMTKDGEECWTAKPVSVGQSFEALSDKGRKATVKRVSYTRPQM